LKLQTSSGRLPARRWRSHFSQLTRRADDRPGKNEG
jgi:hypothetical protein